MASGIISHCTSTSVACVAAASASVACTADAVFVGLVLTQLELSPALPVMSEIALFA